MTTRTERHLPMHTDLPGTEFARIGTRLILPDEPPGRRHPPPEAPVTLDVKNDRQADFFETNVVPDRAPRVAGLARYVAFIE